MTRADFLHERVGRNWVIARRTPNILRRYGEDVVCLSSKRYATLEREYRELYGDPHDKVRAALYVNLRNMVRLYEQLQGHETAYSREAKAALVAEAVA